MWTAGEGIQHSAEQDFNPVEAGTTISRMSSRFAESPFTE
jgi:hypothetical protein